MPRTSFRWPGCVHVLSFYAAPVGGEGPGAPTALLAPGKVLVNPGYIDIDDGSPSMARMSAATCS
ncbi:hypothetical protein [Streptomyces sp. NBC_01614]|uniref:hypothetical protein n=1 Tax=Streptomyces sp. NBC_01614 TaxID=2975897 RepID=UPI00386CEA6D